MLFRVSNGSRPKHDVQSEITDVEMSPIQQSHDALSVALSGGAVD